MAVGPFARTHWPSFSTKQSWLFQAPPKQPNNQCFAYERAGNVAFLAFVCAFSFVFTTFFVFINQDPHEPVPNPGPKDGDGGVVRPEYLLATVNETDPPEERLAYCTFLASTDEKAAHIDDDLYFTATRILVWQLLHDPTTRTKGIDVVVMVAPDVSQEHRDRLEKDGAIVRPVELLHSQSDTWIKPKFERWNDVMTKLRVWEMEEYSRVLMLDGDMLLQSPLDGVFYDPATRLLRTKPGVGRKEDEPELPEHYMLATYEEIYDKWHLWPPREYNHHARYFNAGFFLLKPDRKMFDYLVGLMDIEGRFDPRYPEQNLMNYVFRWDGAMPFNEIDYRWNIRYATEDDLEGGIISMHEKWWKPRSGGNTLRDFMRGKRWEMRGYYLGLEGS